MDMNLTFATYGLQAYYLEFHMFFEVVIQYLLLVK